ncbi:hypothetical protein [Pseudazoarcus pumilus]|uniref:Uncharacterized protein n=1 Tax=Pseudazoarcus pumilus TaxID=2067960 RepID=A0A2I6S9C9_9RHOO|nr:hypothetical protein [Pseudazoarcus pumilus]AUN95855.1 hypothetical protein C0099_13505 [Pseudazoarcus pumilus]
MEKAERARQPVVRGELKVFENRLHPFNRSVLCAQVLGALDGLEQPLIPELADVHLIWLDGKRLRLRGNEMVEGALFAQTWDVRLV